jgi:outer membrane protein OmpA-like peptidoglycan-associated protein
MSIESNSDDGSDIFWPGYVDAVTNLVLNLLFLLTIMTVAVFMFALELGRAKPGDQGVAVQIEAPVEPQTLRDPIKEREEVVAALRKQVEALNKEAPTEVEALKKQVEAINQALEREARLLSQLAVPRKVEVPNELQTPQKVLPATSAVPKPEKGLEQTSDTGGGIIVRFTDEAVTLTEAETRTLRNTLGVIAAAGGARIEVVVPRGFSEAKRLGFYRAMAVRNLLIEMKLPADKIEVSVREGKSNSNASLVRVTSR